MIEYRLKLFGKTYDYVMCTYRKTKAEVKEMLVGEGHNPQITLHMVGKL